MSDPCWSAYAYQDAQYFTFPNLQTFIHEQFTGNDSQINCTSVIPNVATYFEIVVQSLSDRAWCAGVIAKNYTGPNIALNCFATAAYPCACIFQDGGIITNATFTSIVMGAWSVGTVISVYINAAQTGIAFSYDGITWNGSYTTAQILAGVGFVALGSWGALTPFASLKNDGGTTHTASMSIYSSLANCARLPPAGAAYLSSFGQLQITQVNAFVGQPSSISWSLAGGGTIASGLNYILDLGTPVACTGSVTGNAGTAVGPTISEGFHFIQLEDNNNQINITAQSQIGVLNKPSGAGNLVFQSIATYIQQNGPYTFTLPNGPYDKLYVSLLYENFIGTTGAGNVSLFDSANDETCTFSFADRNPITLGGGGTSTSPPTSGPSSVSISGSIISATGTLDATYKNVSAGTTTTAGTSTILIEGTLTQYGSTLSPNGWGAFNNVAFNSVQITPEALFGTVGVAFAVWTPLETLSLDTGIYNNSNLVVSGKVEYAELTALEISTDDGSTFQNASSLSVTGTAYTASFMKFLSNGIYTLFTKDGVSLIESNSFTLTVTENVNLLNIQIGM